MIETLIRMPSPSEYLALVAETGWDMPDMKMTETALAASLCGVVAIKDGKVIGMTRAVGDGVMKVYIQDMIVTKAHRNTGVGIDLMQAILEALSNTCPASCMIGLFAAEGRAGFYTQFGFTTRPSVGFGPGMHATLSDLAKAQNAA